MLKDLYLQIDAYLYASDIYLHFVFSSIFFYDYKKDGWLNNVMKGVGYALYVICPLYQSCVILRSVLVGHRLHTPVWNKCPSNPPFILTPQTFLVITYFMSSYVVRIQHQHHLLRNIAVGKRVWFIPWTPGTLRFSVWSRRAPKWYRVYSDRYENYIWFRGRQRGYNGCSQLHLFNACHWNGILVHHRGQAHEPHRPGAH